MHDVSSKRADEMLKYDESPESGGDKQKAVPRSKVNLRAQFAQSRKQRKEKAIVPYENTAA